LQFSGEKKRKLLDFVEYISKTCNILFQKKTRNFSITFEFCPCNLGKKVIPHFINIFLTGKFIRERITLRIWFYLNLSLTPVTHLV